MSKIDIHTHILPRDIPKFKDKFGYGGFISLDHNTSCKARMVKDDGTFFREIESNCWDPAQRIKECNDHGVDIQVLSTVPIMFSYWAKPKDGLEISKFINDHICEVVSKNPKRFLGLANLPMQDVGLAVKELERSIKVLKLSGIQIGTHVDGMNFDDPRLFPIFEAAVEYDIPIFVHPWDMLGMKRLEKYWLAWLVGMPAEISVAICSMIFGGVFERLPKLRIAFAHGGGSFSGTVGRINHGFHARPDLCAIDNKISPKDYLGRFFVDSHVSDSQFLKYIVDLYGSNRVVLGSDYPFPLGEARPGELIESISEFDKTTKESLLYRNALEWLGRPSL